MPELQFSPNEIVVISAMSENHMIGSGNGMPWNVPEEYAHFLDSVRNQVVIMGRRSYEIFGNDFEAETFVISRNAELNGVNVCDSIENAIAKAKDINKTIFVSGGRSIYSLGIPLASRMLLSTIKGDFDGDVTFPEFDESEWRVELEEDHERYTLRDLRRIVS